MRMQNGIIFHACTLEKRKSLLQTCIAQTEMCSWNKIQVYLGESVACLSVCP